MEKLQRKYTPETNSIKKFKSTKLHVDEEIYKEVQNTVQKQKNTYFVWENIHSKSYKTSENIKTAS